MPPSCWVGFFPPEGITIGNNFWKPATMKADPLTQAPLLHSLGLSQNQMQCPEITSGFSVVAKLHLTKSCTWKHTWGLVSFPQVSKTGETGPNTKPDTEEKDFSSALMLFHESRRGFFSAPTADSWLTYLQPVCNGHQCPCAFLSQWIHSPPNKGTFLALPWINWQRARLKLMSLVILHPSGRWADVLHADCKDTQPPEQGPCSQLRPQTHCRQQKSTKSPIYPLIPGMQVWSSWGPGTCPFEWGLEDSLSSWRCRVWLLSSNTCKIHTDKQIFFFPCN